jgi:hypothetical protein
MTDNPLIAALRGAGLVTSIRLLKERMELYEKLRTAYTYYPVIEFGGLKYKYMTTGLAHYKGFPPDEVLDCLAQAKRRGCFDSINILCCASTTSPPPGRMAIGVVAVWKTDRDLTEVTHEALRRREEVNLPNEMSHAIARVTVPLLSNQEVCSDLASNH